MTQIQQVGPNHWQGPEDWGYTLTLIDELRRKFNNTEYLAKKII